MEKKRKEQKKRRKEKKRGDIYNIFPVNQRKKTTKKRHRQLL